jgi:hypothetical protein
MTEEKAGAGFFDFGWIIVILKAFRNIFMYCESLRRRYSAPTRTDEEAKGPRMDTDEHE